MEPLTLSIETRSTTGKGAARQLRARGLVPGVFYGPDLAPLSVAVPPKALTQALSTPHRRNTLLKIQVDGQEHLAMIKDVQVHPVTRQLRHVDLYKVSLERAVAAWVPFQTEGRAKGVVAGGELHVVFRDLPVRTTPDKIPDVIRVDVTQMGLGDFFRVKDLNLPSGIEVTLDPERSLISCAEPRKRAAEEEGQAAEGAPAQAG